MLIALVFFQDSTYFLNEVSEFKGCEKILKEVKSYIPPIYDRMEVSNRKVYKVKNSVLAMEEFKTIANEMGYYFAFKRKHTLVFVNPTSLSNTLYDGKSIRYFSGYLFAILKDDYLCVFEIQLR